MSTFYFMPLTGEILSPESVTKYASLTDIPRTLDSNVSYEEQYLRDNNAVMFDGEIGHYYDHASNTTMTRDELMDNYESILSNAYFDIVFDDEALPFGTTIRNAWPELFAKNFEQYLQSILEIGVLLEVYDYE